MALTQIRRAVGTFPTRREAEHALHELERSGFPMERVSVIAKDSNHPREIAGTEVVKEPVGNKADDGAKAGALSGGALGGIGGLLVGLGVLAIPGLGPVMLAGAGATVLATALSGTAIGAAAGGLLGALVGLGIPEKEARVYHDRISRGDYLVMVEGTDDDIHHAERVLKHHAIQDWGVYNTADSPHTETVEQTQPAVVPAQQAIVSSASHPIMDSGSIRLYEERLRIEKARQKTGEVIVNKHVETETAEVTVPIEKERIVVQRVDSPEVGKAIVPNENAFREGEVVRMEVYEEVPNVQKQAVVREEVQLRKEADRQAVNAEDTVRYEELDVNVQGHPRVDRKADLPLDRI